MAGDSIEAADGRGEAIVGGVRVWRCCWLRDYEIGRWQLVSSRVGIEEGFARVRRGSASVVVVGEAVG